MVTDINISTFGRKCRHKETLKKEYEKEKVMLLFGIPVFSINVPKNKRSKYILDVCGVRVKKIKNPTGKYEINTYENNIVFSSCHDENKSYDCSFYDPKNIFMRLIYNIIKRCKK